MTGYGKAEAVLETGKLAIEIKTLNGKNSDANIKSSLLPKDKELLVRRKITDSLVRGTIDFYITWEPKAGGMAKQINKELLREYYDQLWTSAPRFLFLTLCLSILTRCSPPSCVSLT